MKIHRTSAFRGAALTAATVVLFGFYSPAQQVPAASAAPADIGSSVRELQDQLQQLRSLVEQMREENAQSRAEMKQLRQDLTATRTLLERSGANSEAMAKAAPESESSAAASGSGNPAATQDSNSLEQRIEKLEESSSLIGSKIDEQYQTKVETASKYRARLHGIILMNAFRNVGGSNSVDFPDMSEPVDPGSPLATMGATLRQS